MSDHTFDLHFAPHERTLVERLADTLGMSTKDAVLEAVSHRLEEAQQVSQLPMPKGRLANARHLVGSMRSGIPDLASNPRHLDGYGQ